MNMQFQRPRQPSIFDHQRRRRPGRNTRAGTVGGCRTRAWSSPLSSAKGRTQGEVARAHRVSQWWVSRLVARYQAEGEAAFGPRSQRPKTLAGAISDLIVRRRKDLAPRLGAELGMGAGGHTR